MELFSFFRILLACLNRNVDNKGKMEPFMSSFIYLFIYLHTNHWWNSQFLQENDLSHEKPVFSIVYNSGLQYRLLDICLIFGLVCNNFDIR